MTESKGKKKIVRELAELRGIGYQAALNELNDLPADVMWRPYIEKIREQQKKGTSVEPEQYPEHAKLRAVKNEASEIGAFLDWLHDKKKISLTIQHHHDDGCKDGEKYNRCGYHEDEYMLVHVTPEKLLGEYFEIDPVRLEKEKRAMLAKLRGEAEDDDG